MTLITVKLLTSVWHLLCLTLLKKRKALRKHSLHEKTAASVLLKIYLVAREHLFHPCKGRYDVVYSARLGIGRCYHIHAPAGTRTICNYAREILKNRPVPGRVLNSPVIFASRWNRTASVLFVVIAQVTELLKYKKLSGEKNPSMNCILRLKTLHSKLVRSHIDEKYKCLTG